MEALLSPNEIPPLYPGNRLIGYCTLYDVSSFRGKKTEVSVQLSTLERLSSVLFCGQHVNCAEYKSKLSPFSRLVCSVGAWSGL